MSHYSLSLSMAAKCCQQLLCVCTTLRKRNVNFWGYLQPTLRQTKVRTKLQDPTCFLNTNIDTLIHFILTRLPQRKQYSTVTVRPLPGVVAFVSPHFRGTRFNCECFEQ